MNGTTDILTVTDAAVRQLIKLMGESEKPVAALGLTEIARMAAMIQDHLLIKLAQIGHRPNNSCTLPSPATSRLISSRVL